MKKNEWVPNLLLVLAIAGRLIPHPANFTPLGAVALVGGARLKGMGRWALPFLALLISDILLEIFFGKKAFGFVTPFIYGAFAVNILLGKFLFQKNRFFSLGVFSLLGSLQFFVVTNFAVWLEGMLYPLTGAGLMACYAMALPFLLNTVLGDFFWAFCLYAAMERTSEWLAKKSLQPS